jgi:protease-4
MDFEQNNNLSEPAASGPSESISDLGQSGSTIGTAKKGIGWKIFWGIILALSIVANITLLMMLIGVIVFFMPGRRDGLAEEVLRDGPWRSKIAVITVEGVIHDEQSDNVFRQLKYARGDRWVRGLIVRINSPGGTISNSDQIYNEIRKYRQEEGVPVVAFMQGVAASGGYYISVACEKIVAEPTTITGSIGVMFGHFVVQQLLEEKLGIQPVVITSGPKKDWPSSFQPITEEQRQYVKDKLIGPAYNRFVEVVADGRPELSLDDVKLLADGSIYAAQEARDIKLIDEIGYLDEAIEQVKSLSGLDKVRVVEYCKPFSWAGFLSSRSRNILKIDRDALYELSTPQVLYLWSAY